MPASSRHATARLIRQVWAGMQRGEVRLLDLRPRLERQRYGAPPGAVAVSFARHVANPEPPPAVYLCQHAVRSKLTRPGRLPS